MDHPTNGKELSIAFDNSCGSFGQRLPRVELCVFANKESHEPEETLTGPSDKEIVVAMTRFLLGLSIKEGA